MAKVEKISIALTDELALSVREAVKSGDYASTSEVIRDALRDWCGKRDRSQAELEELRRLVREGERSGVADRHRSADDIIAEGRRRLAAGRTA